MAIPSRVLGAGTSGGTTTAICGDANNAVAAAGNSLATATQLSAVMSVVTSATAVTAIAVKLPKAEPGASVFIANRSGQTISIYPFDASTQINNGTAGNAVTLATAARTQLFAVSTTEWYQGA